MPLQRCLLCAARGRAPSSTQSIAITGEVAVVMTHCASLQSTLLEEIKDEYFGVAELPGGIFMTRRLGDQTVAVKYCKSAGSRKRTVTVNHYESAEVNGTFLNLCERTKDAPLSITGSPNNH